MEYKLCMNEIIVPGIALDKISKITALVLLYRSSIFHYTRKCTFCQALKTSGLPEILLSVCPDAVINGYLGLLIK